MTKPFEPRIYRFPRFGIALCAIGAVMMPLAAFTLYRKEGFTLLAIGAMAGCVLMIAALLDALTTEVRVEAEQLIIFNNFRRRVYVRSAFTSVTWSKGAPVSLLLQEGGWVSLPPVEGSGQGKANTLRAWLKRATEESRSRA